MEYSLERGLSRGEGKSVKTRRLLQMSRVSEQGGNSAESEKWSDLGILLRQGQEYFLTELMSCVKE